MNRWLLTLLAVLVAVLAAGLGFRPSYGGAIAVYTFVFVALFFGWFGLMWCGAYFGTSVSDWVADVRRMAWTTPDYWIWLYENRQREWAAVMTLWSVGIAIFFGAVLCNGTFSFENSVVGFGATLAILTVVALCWYKGFWKPRTRVPTLDIPPSVEAEWRDKRL